MCKELLSKQYEHVGVKVDINKFALHPRNRSDNRENKTRVVRTKRTVTALAQTLTSVAKMILQMCLIWKNSTKRILTSVLSRKGVNPQTLERDGSGNPNDEVPG